MGNCSNLQAWIESGYDTRLMYYSLTFPLLRELVNLGDIEARKVFEEEIVSRFVNGSRQVKLFLFSEGFLSNFNLSERDIINEGLDEVFTTSYFAKNYLSEEELVILFDKNELSKVKKVNVRPKYFSKSFIRKYRHLKTIFDITEVSELRSLTDITSLTLSHNNI